MCFKTKKKIDTICCLLKICYKFPIDFSLVTGHRIVLNGTLNILGNINFLKTNLFTNK